jgi:NADH:ubiquinone oxidoreductase subunit 2 (subunit N)
VLSAPLVFLLRRWWIGNCVAALVSFFVALLAWSFPPTNPFRLLGRPFLLDSLTQYVLVVLFAMAGVLFLAAWKLPQGRSFSPFGLILLGLWSLAGMSRHLGLTALVITVAATGAVPILQGGKAGPTRAAWRFVMVMLLALPFFLLAAWRVDLYREDVDNAVYLSQAALLLALGMWLWLAVVPWHGWLTAIGSDAPPMGATLILTGFPLLALVNLSQVLTEATWFTWMKPTGQLLLWAGVISVAVGGVLAAVQRGFRPLMGYAALFDLGCLLVAITVGDESLFLVAMAVRALGLALTGVAIASLRQSTGEDGFSGLGGAARHMRLTSMALIAGGLTLSGLPLTAGFFPRWLLVHELARANSIWVWLLTAGGVGVAVGYLRGLRAMLAPPLEPSRNSQPSESWPVMILLAGLILLTLGLGLIADPLFQLPARWLDLYSLPAF